MTANEEPNRTYDEPKQKRDPPAPSVERLRREVPRYERPQKCTDKHSQALADHLPGAVETAPMRRSTFDEEAWWACEPSTGGKPLQQARQHDNQVPRHTDGRIGR